MTTDSIDRSLAKLNKDIDSLKGEMQAAALKVHHPKLTPALAKLLDKYTLTASAAEGRLTVREVDKALMAQGLPIADRMAVKLELSAADVLAQ